MRNCWKGWLAPAVAITLAQPALAQAGPWDRTFADLTYANAVQNECSAIFPSGSVTFTFADQEASATPIVVIKGRTNKPLRVGERLYAQSFSRTTYRALVVAADETSAIVVLPDAFASWMWFSDYDYASLYPSPSLELLSSRALLLDAEYGTLRTKLSEAIHCTEQLYAGD